MAEPTIEKQASASPRTIYRHEYQPPPFMIDAVELNFNLQDELTIVDALLTIHRQSANHAPLILQGEKLELLEIKLDGKMLSEKQYELTDEHLIIPNVPDHFQLQTQVKIYPQLNTALSGLYLSNGKYCTQCEAEGFRRITYFIDQPDNLSQFMTTIIADEKKYPYLLSNGNLIASGKKEAGRHYATWQDPFKKPSYLFALVAGDFDLIEDHFITQSKREIALRIYVEKGYADQTQHAMYSLQEAMRWDEKAYGREYDLDIYMIVAIGDFNMGAMENKGLNIFNTKYILAKPETATDQDYINILSVIGHEYFHNWSGNRVTCRDWFQLSLKEGLTIFRDQSFSEDLLSQSVMRIQDVMQLREVQFPEDAGPLAHPVRPESYIQINNFYTSTIYNKGAEVLRMLQTLLGKEKFRQGMDEYFAKFDGQAVTIEDFIQTMESVSQHHLQSFRLWYSQAGTPTVHIEDDYDAAKKIYRLTMTQSCPSTPGQETKMPLPIPIRMGLLENSGKEIELIRQGKSLGKDYVLELTKASEIIEFEQVDALPIPSFLRHFSAPVKLRYAYSEEDLQFLAKFDTDAFNRWEMSQQYLLKVIVNLINDYQHNQPLKFPQALSNMFQALLQNDQHDPFLLAEMLSLPSEKYIGEQMKVIDVNAIHVVREFIMQELAIKLEDLFANTYHHYHESTSQTSLFACELIGQRSLKNLCLNYLLTMPRYFDLAIKQFEQALKLNMTDALAALRGMVNSESSQRKKILDQFYNTWKNDALVVDKWLAIQADCKLPTTLQEVKNLTHSSAFDLKNPNKVYALIGTFAARNLINFHQADGEGYAFLREMVRQLDILNPQVAARMIIPLTAWQRYDTMRQNMMREQLQLLVQEKSLSKDLYEIVTKSLN